MIRLSIQRERQIEALPDGIPDGAEVVRLKAYIQQGGQERNVVYEKCPCGNQITLNGEAPATWAQYARATGKDMVPIRCTCSRVLVATVSEVLV